MQIPRLREWRELHGWTQKDLARESGVSLRSIAGYEAGAGVRPNTARKLAEALGVEVADLVVTSGKASAPPSPEQPSFNGLLEEERRLQYLRTWESFIRQISGRWHARMTEREKLGLELEAAWADELGDLHLEIGQVVIHGLLRGWDESTAPEREKNLMNAIARALDYLGDVMLEASRRTRTQQEAESRKQQEAEMRRATQEIQTRAAG